MQRDIKTETRLLALDGKNQWAVLGGLRFALASIVFWTHFGGYARLPFALTSVGSWGAFSAVLGFFIVSGYSIASSLAREGIGFYERRLTRIYPTYFACMILACVPFLLFGSLIGGGADAPKSVWPIVGNFFFFGGIVVPAMPTNPVVWSLAIEVLYYLLAPLFFKMRSRFLLGIALISSIVYWLHNSFNVPDFNTALHGSYGAVAMLWAWLFGFLLYRCRGSKLLLPACLIAGCVLIGRYNQSGLYSSAILVISLLLVGYAREISLPVRLTKSLEYLGELSYPLYLCHVPVLLLLYGSGIEFAWIVGLAGCVLGSVLLLHGVDLPYRAYARRTTGRRQSRILIDAEVSEPELVCSAAILP